MLHELLLEEGWRGPDGETDHSDIEKLREALIDLYLSVKIRSNEEVIVSCNFRSTDIMKVS
jgi:hypothetical protein